MITNKTLPENDGPEAFESILQIGRRFVRSGVQQEMLSKSFKVSASWKAPKN